MFNRIKKAAVSAAVAVSLFVGTSVAMAVEPGEAVFTAMGTTAGVYITAGFVLLGIVLTGTIGMKLAKKILSRAT